jgi:hypothetical protein
LHNLPYKLHPTNVDSYEELGHPQSDGEMLLIGSVCRKYLAMVASSKLESLSKSTIRKSQAVPRRSRLHFTIISLLGRWQALELQTFISQCVERNIPVIPVLLLGVAEIPENLLNS